MKDADTAAAIAIAIAVPRVTDLNTPPRLVPLRRATLGELADRAMLPRFDRGRARPGIVHLGLGGFHRAHMALYTQEVLDDGRDADWGIVGVGLLPRDATTVAALAAQDGLYALTERDAQHERVRVIGSVVGAVNVIDGPHAVLEAMDAATVRIVSLTVTEKGYCLDAATKRLDPAHPVVRADLARAREPRGAIGLVVEGLRRRRAAARTPFTVLCCDNIQHNGGVLRQAVLDYAHALDPALAAWIDTHAAFPSTMVDRITPVTTPEDVRSLAERHGIVDGAPVFCEPFRQWVVEDAFVDGRPRWEDAGVQFVADVTPYEMMKLRLLNATHLGIAGLGRLTGHVFVDAAMRDPRIERYARRLMRDELAPTLAPVPGVNVDTYCETLVERFGNPTLRDTVDRVNADAPLNVLLDPLRDRLRAGASIEYLALALAAWIRRASGVDEAGRPIDVQHPLADVLRTRALEGYSDPRPVLAIESLFGEVGREPRVIADVGRWLGKLYADGTERTLEHA